MLQELEDLSNALDKVTDEDARNLITHINTGLRRVLNAEIIDVLIKEEAKGGGIILRPLSSVVKPGGRDEAAPCPVDVNSKGIWPRVYFDNNVIHLEQIKNKRHSGQGIPNELSKNKLDPEKIAQKDIDEIYSNTDSVLCLPLSIEHSTVGIFCIELPESGIINSKIYSFLKRISACYALLVWQVTACNVSKKHTVRAIEHYKVTVTDAKIRELLSHSRKGVLLRPFGNEFNLVDTALCQAFSSHALELQHFIASPGAGVMEELRAELKLSPFGVVDISGLNPNVLIEYGMMKVIEKDLMLLRNTQDKQELPFDIRADQVDCYELRGNEAHIIEPGSGNLVPLKERVSDFVQNLKNKGILQ